MTSAVNRVVAAALEPYKGTLEMEESVTVTGR